MKKNEIKNLIIDYSQLMDLRVDFAFKLLFAKWMSVITQQEITNKTIIENAYRDDEEIFMAVSALVKYGEDKHTRQMYARRRDDIQNYNVKMMRAEQDRLTAEQERQRANQLQTEKEQANRRAEKAEAEIEQLRKQLATLQTSQN